MASPNDSATSSHVADNLELDGISLRQVARVIHGLNSRLLSVTEQWRGATLVLVYTFDVAGKQQSFCVPISGVTIESIADLFPEATAQEQAVRLRHGLTFTTEGV